MEKGPFNPKVKWVIPHIVRGVSFLGRDVVAVAYDVYIVFVNLRSGAETVYVANDRAVGDGVDVLACGRSAIFAFAEKVRNPRILVLHYPTFVKRAELKDEEVRRYQGLCMLEGGELVAGFTSFPNYLLTVWSWRSRQRLLRVPTGVVRNKQIFLASRMNTLICQCYGEGVAVWEVAPCYKRTFMLRRASETKSGWDVPEPPLLAAAFAGDGCLYAVDAKANLYGMTSDGIYMVRNLEWQSPAEGEHTPRMSALGQGLLLFGPDRHLRWLKKAESKWTVAWTHPLCGDNEMKPEDLHLLLSDTERAEEEDKAAEETAKIAEETATTTGSGADTRGSVAGEMSDKSMRLPASIQTVHIKRGTLDAVEQMGSNAGGDSAVLWTHLGRVLHVQLPGETAGHVQVQLSHTHAHAPAPPVRPTVRLVAYKQRNIKRIKMIAPDFNYVVTINDQSMLCVYHLQTGRLVRLKYIDGHEVSFSTSPTDPLLVVFGLASSGTNYGLTLLEWHAASCDLVKRASVCLTHQSITRVVFSPTGQELMATAMAAGHVFIYKVSPDYKLSLVRYSEIGRGLADCMFMRVGDNMRAFNLVLVSDKYYIGERIACIDTVTAKDNKFAGKMQGPYSKLLALHVKDTLLAIPHLSRQFHLLKLSAQGTTVTVKMGPIVDTGHELRDFSGWSGTAGVVTFGADGFVIKRDPDIAHKYEFKVTVAHRYEAGVTQAVVDDKDSAIVHLATNKTVAALYTRGAPPEEKDPRIPPPDFAAIDPENNTIVIIGPNEKNYLDLMEDKKVHEETVDYKPQRDEVVRVFETLQAQLVALLEENIAERPLHQLSLAEFNLHLENKKERNKAAEKEREEIRLRAEARIRGQDAVTAWIKSYCWDTMQMQRVKIFAIFSHYHVENYPVLPTQRESWPELEKTRIMRGIEMMNDADLFRPWEEVTETEELQKRDNTQGPPLESTMSVATAADSETAGVEPGQPYALSGTNTHKYIALPDFAIPQTMAYSYLHMDWLGHITKLNVQNMRLWFNKQFDELMATKRREVGLVEERNARLRFIIEELNKLSDLRGSFHHLMIKIHDPEWRQEETPEKLIKVDPEECSIPPYISPSQIVIPPPELGPKDDFRERALNEMMDGVLEKLWHEEIKKPIPMPQCMLDKDPEHFNEEDLRLVFDYEAKVAFRNEEREKYRKMLHAEYARLSQTLNENVVKFNMKVKDMWLTRLRVDSVIGQETLNMMRLRRTNLDRLEMAEEVEKVRGHIADWEAELEALSAEAALIAEQAAECQMAYEATGQRDRAMDRSFKNNFGDLSPILAEQIYKLFKRRPKWYARAAMGMAPAVLYELAAAVASGVRPPLMNPDCLEYAKALDQLDVITNMPAVLEEPQWTTMCRLRRAKVETEIRMRALALEMGYAEAAMNTWARACNARRTFLANAALTLQQLRDTFEHNAMNRTIQLVLPAGQVEVVTSGHMEDFEDAALIPRSEVETINNLILKVGDIKLRMMRRQIEFRKGILAKEWEHAQMKMKLRHMRQELNSYDRLKIPKELQWYLKNKEKGYTDEMDYMRLEKEMAGNKMMIDRVLQDSSRRCEEMQVKINELEAAEEALESTIVALHLKVSEKRLNEDALEPIRIRQTFKKRMEVLVGRSQLIRQVQDNHTTIVLLQTELELLRLRTFPTLAKFRTFC